MTVSLQTQWARLEKEAREGGGPGESTVQACQFASSWSSVMGTCGPSLWNLGSCLLQEQGGRWLQQSHIILLKARVEWRPFTTSTLSESCMSMSLSLNLTGLNLLICKVETATLTCWDLLRIQ